MLSYCKGWTSGICCPMHMPMNSYFPKPRTHNFQFHCFFPKPLPSLLGYRRRERMQLLDIQCSSPNSGLRPFKFLVASSLWELKGAPKYRELSSIESHQQSTQPCVVNTNGQPLSSMLERSSASICPALQLHEVKGPCNRLCQNNRKQFICQSCTFLKCIL